MADGRTKPIKDVRVGDKVVATDPKTGRTRIRTITALHRNQDTDLADLTVTDGHGHTTTIHTTQHHPFWNDGRHTWTEAGELQPGERLYGATGDIVTVQQVMSFRGDHTMDNLTVEDIHTYYVVPGGTPVLVHNCGGGINEEGEPCDCNGDPIKEGKATEQVEENNETIEGAYDDAGEYGDTLASAGRAVERGQPTAVVPTRGGGPEMGPDGTAVQGDTMTGALIAIGAIIAIITKNLRNRR
jgi:Pretoxin HINT domain